MQARPQPPLLQAWMTVVAIVLLLAGLALEITLAHETLDARATLRYAVARASPLSASVEHDDADLLAEARQGLARHDFDAARALLAARAEAVPTPATRRLASLAAASTASFRDAARQATFASRLAPGDDAALENAEDALDLALLGRLRTPTRIAGGAAALFLLACAVHASRRRRRQRLLDRWLDGVEGRMSVSVDGRCEPGDGVVPADTHALSVDVFLHAKGAPPRPPRPGPTLALVLSHAASNTTLRLTPVRDVVGDAVRTRLKEGTLARVLAHPGTWRILARLDGRPVVESRLEVEPPASAPATGPARRLLHLVARA